MSGKIVHGRALVCDADTVIPSGALYIEGDRIVAVGGYAEITKRFRAEVTLGSAEALVVPGFVNAHGHGKGITDFQRGALDDHLEVWKFRGFPPVDPRLDTLWTGVRLLENGVTATMHNHNLSDPEDAEAEFSAVINAYRECGLRLAFAPTLVNRNLFVYGDNESFIRCLDPGTASLCRDLMRQSESFGAPRYYRAVDDLAREFASEQVRIMHGPLAPQWVREEDLQEIRRRAARDGLRIHIHTQQTRLQRLYGLKTCGESPVARLDRLGFWADNVTCGHAVWLSAGDIACLARAGVSVTHHPACNLRVRNGIAPVAALLAAGIRVGIGMDDKELADDKDYLAELRLAARLHRVDSHRPGDAALPSREFFRMGTEHGAQILGFGGLTGALRPGMRADLVVLSTERMREPYTYPGHDPIDLLLYRGRGTDVDSVLVGGEVLVAGGRHTRVDREEVKRKLAESVPADYAARFEHAASKLAGLKQAVAAWFAPWAAELEAAAPSPYYHMNDSAG